MSMSEALHSALDPSKELALLLFLPREMAEISILDVG